MWVDDHAASQTDGMSGGGPQGATMVGISGSITPEGTLGAVLGVQILLVSWVR